MVTWMKLNQCNDTIKNATIVSIERIRNRDTMDEEFQALIDYVDQKLLMKTIMGLKVQWKEK
jgi:hypothetical protein